MATYEPQLGMMPTALATAELGFTGRGLRRRGDHWATISGRTAAALAGDATHVEFSIVGDVLPCPDATYTVQSGSIKEVFQEVESASGNQMFTVISRSTSSWSTRMGQCTRCVAQPGSAAPRTTTPGEVITARTT